jgi:hypothetical protein
MAVESASSYLVLDRRSLRYLSAFSKNGEEELDGVFEVGGTGGVDIRGKRGGTFSAR